MSEQTNFSNMLEFIRFKVTQNPNKRIITFLPDGESEQHHLSYADIDAQARALAARLQTLAAVGDRAILLYPPGLDMIAAFFGCFYAGIVPIVAEPLHPGRPPDMLLGIVANAQPKLVLTIAGMQAEVQNIFAQYSALRPLPLVATDILLQESDPDAWHPPTLSDDALLYVNYTSGSTRTPRGVMMSHRAILQTYGRMDYKPAPDDLTVNWLPQYHISGISTTTLLPLIMGLPVVFMPPGAFLERPLRWLQAITRFRATSSSAPNFAYQLCVERITPEERRDLDLSSWKSAGLGMEPVRANTLEQFAAAFAPYGFRKEAFMIVYGLSEAGSTSRAYNPKTLYVKRSALEENRVVPTAPGEPDSVAFVSNGVLRAKGALSIVDPVSLTALPTDCIGEVWMTGNLANAGYLNNLAGTQETFNAYLADTHEGPFLRTGDLGFFHDGELYISGRLKDMLIIRGRNYYATDIEHVAGQAHPALMPGAAAVFGVPINGQEQVVIVHEVKPDLESVDVDEISRAIRSAVAAETHLPVHAITLLKSGSLPRTAVGKIQRYLVREQYLAHRASTSGTVGTTPKEEIKNESGHR